MDNQREENDKNRTKQAQQKRKNKQKQKLQSEVKTSSSLSDRDQLLRAFLEAFPDRVSEIPAAIFRGQCPDLEAT